MENFEVVEGRETFDDLDEDIPNLLFFELGSSFLVVKNLLKQVSSVCVLHDDAA